MCQWKQASFLAFSFSKHFLCVRSFSPYPLLSFSAKRFYLFTQVSSDFSRFFTLPLYRRTVPLMIYFLYVMREEAFMILFKFVGSFVRKAK